MNKVFAWFAGTLLIAISTGAFAAVINPVSYDMLNGYSGSYNYWDDSYNGIGCKTCNHAPLSDGTGDLTDGIIATQNWYQAEGPAGPQGPYVGWFQINPSINFHFDTLTNIDTVRIYVDDSNGSGGVTTPLGVWIGGVYHSISDPASATPLSLTFSGLSLSTSDLNITFNRKTDWVFVSEIQFEGTTVVPVPAAAWLFSSGLLGLVGVARRKAS